jgi:hypothetical protein
MKVLRLLILLALLAWVPAAWGGQVLTVDSSALNGNWKLVTRPDTGQLKNLAIILRVRGDKIYGELAITLPCGRADGHPIIHSWQVFVEGDIASDGSFSVTNENAVPMPVHSLLVHGVLPGGDANGWNGSFSVSAITEPDGDQCDAASGDIVLTRFQSPGGVYSGMLHVQGTNETPWITLNMSSGELAKARPSHLFDWYVRVDATIDVSPTPSFAGGRFATGDLRQGESRMGPEYFVLPFPEENGALMVAGSFDPSHDNQILIYLTRWSKGVPYWVANGVLIRQGDLTRQ